MPGGILSLPGSSACRAEQPGTADEQGGHVGDPEAAHPHESGDPREPGQHVGVGGASTSAPSLHLQLEPGLYTVALAYEDQVTQFEIEIRAGETTQPEATVFAGELSAAEYFALERASSQDSP